MEGADTSVDGEKLSSNVFGMLVPSKEDKDNWAKVSELSKTMVVGAAGEKQRLDEVVALALGHLNEDGIEAKVLTDEEIEKISNQKEGLLKRTLQSTLALEAAKSVEIISTGKDESDGTSKLEETTPAAPEVPVKSSVKLPKYKRDYSLAEEAMRNRKIRPLYSRAVLEEIGKSMAQLKMQQKESEQAELTRKGVEVAVIGHLREMDFKGWDYLKITFETKTLAEDFAPRMDFPVKVEVETISDSKDVESNAEIQQMVQLQEIAGTDEKNCEVKREAELQLQPENSVDLSAEEENVSSSPEIAVESLAAAEEPETRAKIVGTVEKNSEAKRKTEFQLEDSMASSAEEERVVSSRETAVQPETQAEIVESEDVSETEKLQSESTTAVSVKEDVSSSRETAVEPAAEPEESVGGDDVSETEKEVELQPENSVDLSVEEEHVLSSPETTVEPLAASEEPETQAEIVGSDISETENDGELKPESSTAPSAVEDVSSSSEFAPPPEVDVVDARKEEECPQVKKEEESVPLEKKKVDLDDSEFSFNFWNISRPFDV